MIPYKSKFLIIKSCHMFLSDVSVSTDKWILIHWPRLSIGSPKFDMFLHLFVSDILVLAGCKITCIAEWNGQFSINDMWEMDRSYISYHCLKPRRHRIGSHYTAALVVKLGNLFVAAGNKATQEYFTGKHLFSVRVWQTCFIVSHVTIVHFHQIIN